ncbi:RWD-domain-containing protein, partial [Myriangium duriaei CBS 260.36]
DEREEELETLSSIYPELVRDTFQPFQFNLCVPISPANPIKIIFTPSELLKAEDQVSEATIKHLPPVQIAASLPATYPSEAAPDVRLSTSPSWLPAAKIKELETESAKLWEEYGRCQILFAYIDHIQQAADRAFDLADKLTIHESLKSDILAFDQTREKEIFETGSYECGVCLEPKKGSLCHRLQACGHVFCRPCLQDFYNAAITEGDVVNITCLEPSCGKSKVGGHGNKKKALHPRELLEIGVPEPQARRFVELKRKKKLESDKSTIYCPRTWCQAPARSSNFAPIPSNLLDYVDSDDSGDESSDPPPVYTKDTPDKQLPAPSDRLTICSKCSFAFCRVCYSGWHGEFARCWPRNPAELSEEEKASYDYIRLHTSPCPTCSSPTQKTMGCNHMSCFQCNTHFCYLCGAWLDSGNPYQHFNNKGSSCYMRLWELEEGDEGAGEVAFVGARRWEAEARAIAAAADEEEAQA